MPLRRWLALSGLVLLSGCSYHVQEQTDQSVCALAAHPFDLSRPHSDVPSANPPKGSASGSEPAKLVDDPKQLQLIDLQTTTLMAPDAEPAKSPASDKVDVQIPGVIPGADTERIKLPKDMEEKARALDLLYKKSPPLPEAPTPLPGPDGQPYTLAQLQDIAGHNSYTLQQAASNVKAAEGNVIAARAYSNPTVGLSKAPSSDGSAIGSIGGSVSQTISTGGKLKLTEAAADQDLNSARLALRKARSDLSTAVRTAYFAVLVARETMLVNRAMAFFTDQMLELHLAQLKAGVGAPYEPAALRAQAWTMRLQYQNSIDIYAMAWKQLVTAVGLRQLPLSEVAGRVDRAIPYFDYDLVLAHVLQNHTDVLTTRNTIEKARYNLKLAQVTPWSPDVALSLTVAKDFIVAPQQWSYTLGMTVPIPLWDQNKGPIIAAEAALASADEEPHRVETVLTSNLATAYQSYKTSLEGVEFYRRNILPDLVRSYRGVYERRQVDPLWTVNNFNDLLSAQQALTSSVTTYLGYLGTLWSSAVSVADLLQTDDLFQFAQPHTLPPLADLGSLLPWACSHPCGTPTTGPCPCGDGAGHSTSDDLQPHFSYEPARRSDSRDCPPVFLPGNGSH